MKELFDRHQDRLTDAEDRKLWQSMHDATRAKTPAWKRWGVPGFAGIAVLGAFAFVLFQSGQVLAPTEQLAQAPEVAEQMAPQAEPEVAMKSAAPAEGVGATVPESLYPVDPIERADDAPVLADADAARSRVEAQATAPGVIRGRVTDQNGVPLAFANVIVLSTNLGAMTDSTGTFAIHDVPAGDYALRVSYLGYAAEEVALQVTEGAEIAEDFALNETEVATMQTVVTDNVRGTVRKGESSGERKEGDLAKDKKRDDLAQQTPAEVMSQAISDAIPLDGAGRSIGRENEPVASGEVASRAPAAKPAESWGNIAPLTSAPADETYRNSVGGTMPVNGADFDAMFFEHYGVNPFVDPLDDRFATFAVDVDNASYTLTRSYLNRGAMPPKDAVRVEEFINSFDHHYAPPHTLVTADRVRRTQDETFAIHLDAAPSPFGKGLTLLRVGIKGREVDPRDRKPAVLTFVIDVSGSMNREDRLELVKRSLTLLVDQMRDSDEIGLVVYGSDARVLLEPTAVENRRGILDAINRLQPEGSTNAEAGLVAAYNLAGRHFRSGAINRIVLCSDGVANVGQTGAEDIHDRISREARRGIELTTVGFGMGNYNDVLMEKLANQGDGNYYYVDDLQEARRVFVENLTGTLQTIAKQTKIQVEFDPDQVRRYRLLGYENRDVADKDFRNDAVDAGEVGAGHEVTALFEVKLEPKAKGDFATVRVRHESPETGKVQEEARSVNTRDIARDLRTLDPSFGLDAAVAEFAEILRHSYWAKDGDLRNVLGLAQESSRKLGYTDSTEELVRMIEVAATLTPPQRDSYEVRPSWDPDEDNR